MSRALLGVALPLTTSWLGTRKAAPARYGSSSIQGRRPNQEDRCALAMQPVQPAGRQRLHGKSARWTTLPELTRRASRRIRSLHACDRLPGHPDCALYAVYDGHGGAVSSSPTRRDLLILARRLPTRPKRASGLLGDPVADSRSRSTAAVASPADGRACLSAPGAVLALRVPPWRSHAPPLPVRATWALAYSPQRAAIFCAERMQGYLTRSSHFKARDLAKALHEAFRDCEADFIMVAGREGLRDGTTAVVALVEAKTLTVAHVGDSRGVLCRAGGETISITQDHKPELEAERRRIEALGGFVSHIGCWRAMGILAMSRAIGDLFLKPYVSAEPDISTVQLEDTDEFVVLASDGVFDVFDNEQVVQIVQSASSPQEAANLLTHSAFVAGSLDNVTAVVVALRGYKPAPPSARSLIEPSAPRPGGVAASAAAHATPSSGSLMSASLHAALFAAAWRVIVADGWPRVDESCASSARAHGSSRRSPMELWDSSNPW
jgi:serine/threonine protein phosphatase PrpC